MNTRIIEEVIVPGKRLGRHVQMDEQSLQYRLIDRLPIDMTKPLVDKLWARQVPPFDQGNLGSCVGNGSLGLLATVPFDVGSPRTGGPGMFVPTIPNTMDEAEAVVVYGEATQVDGLGANITDIYPPDDRGSSVLGGMKAMQKMGFIKSYNWGFSAAEILACLSQYGPVAVGFNCYDSFDTPNSSGLVTISANAVVRGGHCWDIVSIDAENKQVWCWNSWGSSWGIRGAFGLGWADLDRLLAEEGEVTTLEVT